MSRIDGRTARIAASASPKARVAFAIGRLVSKYFQA
ncbi:hypothetical protein DSM3645_02468 [Blastopirellula marina DSM 3645]|uniref:Uncharacterized protein n=1 Tax=Blastopirellula marina DSM 3645 TaxID=314230 RepID=A3ZVF7_9BACT|nr:hypothetical protein DSM3645_02468 [Blastopirellula marina DSM 3645]